MAKIKAKEVTHKGNTRYFDENTKEQVITYFKSLNHKGSTHSSKDDLIAELRHQLHTQQEHYEAQLSDKNELIKILQMDIENLKQQQKVKDNQIATANKLADQAQKLNLVDKPHLISDKKEENQTNMTTDTPRRPENFFEKIFKKKK